MTTDKSKVSVYLDEALKQKLARLAKVERRSVSSLAEILFEDAIIAAEKQGKI